MNAHRLLSLRRWPLALHAPPCARRPARRAAPADTLRHVVPMPVVEVSTSRTGDALAARARRRSTRDAAARSSNWGQDTPMALATLPGAYAYSDAGNGIGYSYLSLRGFPQRRISVLVNGVPLNDPESHEVYWIDHPDLLAVHVRGAGAARRGIGALRRGLAGRQRERRDRRRSATRRTLSRHDVGAARSARGG